MMNFVRTQLPLAPEIVGFRENYFVTPNYGKNLTYYGHLPQEHPEDSSLEDMAVHIFYAFGKALGTLHDYGIAHGRPALRDIVYNQMRIVSCSSIGKMHAVGQIHACWMGFTDFYS